MARFDAQTWKDRAWDRFVRAARGRAAGDPVLNRLEKKWFLETLAAEDLRRIVEWCAGHKIDVVFTTECLGMYVSEDRTVYMSGRLSPQKQVAVLLHECGHHLCEVSDSHERFAAGYPEKRPGMKKTWKHKISCLEEEMEAWHRGWKLSRKLDLSITRRVFDDVRVDCIKSYVTWSTSHRAL